jgi:hypothetical protein
MYRWSVLVAGVASRSVLLGERRTATDECGWRGPRARPDPRSLEWGAHPSGTRYGRVDNHAPSDAQPFCTPHFPNRLHYGGLGWNSESTERPFAFERLDILDRQFHI